MAADSTKPIGRILVSRGREEFRVDETGGAGVSIEDGAITRRIEISRSGSTLPLTVVTLYRGVPYVDLRFDVDLNLAQGMTGTNTRFAIALPFSSEKTYVDGAGFMIRDPEDILPGGKAPSSHPFILFTTGKRADGALR